MATVTKVPVCYESALYCYKSAPIRLQKCPGLQKFPTLVTKVPYRVTKVPFFGYKSARSYGSLSLSLSLSLSRDFFVLDVTSLIFRTLASAGANLPVLSFLGIFSMSLS